MVETFFAVVVGCFLLVVAFLIFAISHIIKSPRAPNQRKPSRDTPAADNKLRRDLIRMLAGDSAAAERLVNLIRHQNPGQNEQWYWEKAIEDLERDRR